MRNRSKLSKDQMLDLKEAGVSYRQIAKLAGVQGVSGVLRPTPEQRAAAMKAADGKCGKCGTASGLSLHHVKYGRSPELAVLCTSCHNRLHRNSPAPKPVHIPLPKMVRPLTQRQASILLMNAQGLRDQLIGEALGIALKTVRKHRCAAIRNLGVTTMNSAIYFAMKQGILS